MNTGGRYNPSHEQLETHQHDQRPSARSYHTAVWTGSEMIVWGGTAGTNANFNTGGRYNPEH